MRVGFIGLGTMGKNAAANIRRKGFDLVVSVTGRIEQARVATEVPQGEVCPILLGIPDEDVAALSAAIFAAIGPHRILQISERNRAWASQGRAAQHSSHAGHPRPQR